MSPNSHTNSPKSLHRGRWVAVWLVISFLLLTTSALAVLVIWGFLHPPQGERIIERGDSDGNLIVSADESDLAALAQKVSPSVVSIVSSRNFVEGGSGTGIIISNDGYILTNKHVVEGGLSFSVVTSEGESYDKVKLIGADPLNDIAFLKIEGVDNLTAAEIGDSGTVRVGQKVVAIGNSLGVYQNTVTSGVISGKGRPLRVAKDEVGLKYEDMSDLLQTDAAINPGNSGGPLVNLSGQVIGINTAIYTDAQSMGFAIPINAAKGMIKTVKEKGELIKPYMGVHHITITSDVRAQYNLSAKQGAYIGGQTTDRAVEVDSPAAKAGLREGDVVLKVGGRSVGEQGSLSTIIGEYQPGDRVEMVVNRGGDELKLKLEIGSYRP